MKNPFASETSTNIGLLVARVPVGAHFLMAGYLHLKGGLGSFAGSYLGRTPDWMPQPVASAYAYGLPFLELAAGAMLILGLTTRLGAAFATLVTFVMLTDGGVRLYPHPGHHTTVYLGIALLILCAGGGKYAVEQLAGRRKSDGGGSHSTNSFRL